MNPSQASGYYGQYLNPTPAGAFQPSSGMMGVGTGLNISAPTLPTGAVSSLMAMPNDNFGGSFGGHNTYSPGQSSSLNSLYNNALAAGNMVGGSQLQNLFNQNNAQANMQIGQDQQALSQRGALQGINQYLSQLGQQQQLNGLNMGFSGNMLSSLLGNLMGGF